MVFLYNKDGSDKMKKKLLIFLAIILLLLVVFTVYIFTSFNDNIPILAYHDVLSSPNLDTDVDLEVFKKQIKIIKLLRYKTLSLDEYYSWKYNKLKIFGLKIVITFDDGKESYYTNVLPLLEENNIKSTVFVIKSRIDTDGYLTKEQYEDLKNNHPLVTVASHSYDLHDNELASSEDYDIYNNDIAKYELHNYYAYPYGISNDTYKKALIDNHFKLAFLYSPGKWSNKKENNYLVTRVPIYNSTSFIKFMIKILIKH